MLYMKSIWDKSYFCPQELADYEKMPDGPKIDHKGTKNILLFNQAVKSKVESL